MEFFNQCTSQGYWLKSIFERFTNLIKMKKLIKSACIVAAGLLLSTATVSCNKEKSEDAPKAKTEKKAKSDNLPNYRYVDLDTILSRYNLAKDYNEEMMRMQANAESAAKRHENNIQSLAANIQKKVQNNVYQSQESYQSDQNQLAAAQNNAQKQMGQLQQNMADAAEKAQKAVNDSIEAFIKDYNKKHGYDAIFFKAATLYIDPALDITDEVVEGLNARYNKKN